VERREWQTLLTRLAAVAEPTPRQSYYEVLAFVRLGRRQPAIEAVAEMRERHGHHFLVDAAEELLVGLQDDGRGDDAGEAGADEQEEAAASTAEKASADGEHGDTQPAAANESAPAEAEAD